MDGTLVIPVELKNFLGFKQIISIQLQNIQKLNQNTNWYLKLLLLDFTVIVIYYSSFLRAKETSKFSPLILDIICVTRAWYSFSSPSLDSKLTWEFLIIAHWELRKKAAIFEDEFVANFYEISERNS